MPLVRRSKILILLPIALLGLITSLPATAVEHVFQRAVYAEKIEGFWLGQCIANWTGLVTEMDKIGDTPEHQTLPFYTRDDWGAPDQPNIWSDQPSELSPTIDFVFRGKDEIWGADDDTDIEFLYLHLLHQHETTLLTPQEIRDGWLKHIASKEENYLWVSNERAYRLMENGVLPPATSLPENNAEAEMIDAQLTTELFGLLAPGRPAVALRLAHLPIRTTARKDAAWIAEFYVTMHALAPLWDGTTDLRSQLRWMAERAREQLPASSYAAKMYAFVKAQHDKGGRWEEARDAIHQRYQVEHADGYDQSHKPGNGCFAAGINFAASLVSLFYGEGDLRRTIQIGTLAGWDADNPTATWGGLLGFMLGKQGVENAFGRTFSDRYDIHRTRRDFPQAIDRFPAMAQRTLEVIDRVVVKEMDGTCDLEKDVWVVPAGPDFKD